MRRFAIAAALTGAMIALVGIVSAGASTFSVTPWTYYRGENFGEGTHGTVTSLCTAAGLHLVKAEETSGDSSTGATIGGVAGITLDSLGFDVLAGSHFSGGAPRYNVLTEDQQTHFFGASGATAVDGAPAGYQRYTFNLGAAGDGSGQGGTGDKKVLAINVVFDEQGEATLKNFNVNGTIVNCVVAVVATPTPSPSPSATVAPSATAAPTATPAVVLAQTGGGITQGPLTATIAFAIALVLVLIGAGYWVAGIRRRRRS